MAEFNDDTAALKYIEERGYASYSSIKNVRDCVIPTKRTAEYFDVGVAVHSLLLEHCLEKEVAARLTADMKFQVKMMLQSLTSNTIVKKLLQGSSNEEKFFKNINGCPVLGYIDINGVDAVGDLKTTRHTSKSQFIKDMDFLQAAIYRYVTGKKDFIYIGISKVNYEVFTFNVNEYPSRIKSAEESMHQLTKYIASKINFKTNGTDKKR